MTALQYYLPDSRDRIDLTYDFEHDSRSRDRVTRDDSYCHEVLGNTYDGILISASNVLSRTSSYSAATRRRFLREGVRRMFRAPAHLKFMGDCGAFSYMKEDVPPYSVAQIADFYETVGVDFGLAVDHVVTEFHKTSQSPSADSSRRYDLTLNLADDFYEVSRHRSFIPMGVVQGWSVASMVKAAAQLQKIGYSYLALGGIVRLRDEPLLDLIRQINTVRRSGTRLHLLGIARSTMTARFAELGVTSMDSTSPLRRAWMDSKANYQLRDKSYMALRIPPSLSPKIRKRVEAGELCCTKVTELEQRALASIQAYSRGLLPVRVTLDRLLEYQAVHSPDQDRAEGYARTLTAQPWKQCACEICTRLDHHVILLRGAERNRSRGFHNVAQFYRRFLSELGEPDMVLMSCGAAKRTCRSPARDLYTGSLFRAHAKIARRWRAPVRILSAKYGLVDAFSKLDPYDCKLSALSCDVRRAWALQVAARLDAQLPNGGTVVVLAGQAYKEWVPLVPQIHVVDPLAGLTLGQRLHEASTL